MSDQSHIEGNRLVELVLPGWVPSKKNLLKLTKTGRAYYDPEVKARLIEMEDDAREQWAGRSALLHPAIAMHFTLARKTSDRDNKFTTILDVLVKAGILEDDCCAKSNGVYLILRATIAPTPVTTVWIEPSGDIGPLLAKMDQVDALSQIPAMPARKKRNRWI